MNKPTKAPDEDQLFQQLKQIILGEEKEQLNQVTETLEEKPQLSKKVSPIIEEHLEQLRNNFPAQYKELVGLLIDQKLETVKSDIVELSHLLNDKDQLSEKVSPIIQQHLDFFTKNFPDEFKKAVNEMMELKIKDSQQAILDVITPVLGKLIRQSITHQFQMLKENLEKTLKKTFSKQGLFSFLQRRQSVETEIILSELDKPVIEEIHVIQRDSGLLIGSASLEKNIDRDVIAGMLTAIKSFVEDAFQKEEQDLGMIEYENYKIFIQNFYSYYIATSISGSISASEKDELSSKLFDFAEKELKSIPKDIDEKTTERISSRLKQYFFDTEETEKTAS